MGNEGIFETIEHLDKNIKGIWQLSQDILRESKTKEQNIEN